MKFRIPCAVVRDETGEGREPKAALSSCSWRLDGVCPILQEILRAEKSLGSNVEPRNRERGNGGTCDDESGYDHVAMTQSRHMKTHHAP